MLHGVEHRDERGLETLLKVSTARRPPPREPSTGSQDRVSHANSTALEGECLGWARCCPLPVVIKKVYLATGGGGARGPQRINPNTTAAAPSSAHGRLLFFAKCSFKRNQTSCRCNCSAFRSPDRQHSSKCVDVVIRSVFIRDIIADRIRAKLPA